MYQKNANWKIFFKTLLLIALPTIFIMGAAVFLFAESYRDYSKQYYDLSVQHTISRNMETFDRINADFNRQAHHLSSGSYVVEFLLNETIMTENRNLRSLVAQFSAVSQSSMTANSYLKDISVFSGACGYVLGTGTSGYVEKIGELPWLEEYFSNNRSARYVSYLQDGEVCLVYLFPVSLYGSPRGVVAFELNYSEFLNLFDTEMKKNFIFLMEKAL